MKSKSNHKSEHKSLSEWNRICRDFVKSGLSQAEFCRREGLAHSTFSKWIKRMPADRDNVLLSQSEQFIEITDNASNSYIFVELSDLKIRIPTNISPYNLKNILNILRG